MSTRLLLRVANLVLVLAALGALTACVSFPTENQDPAKNNKATYNKDFKECQEDYPESGSGTHLRQWMGCMQLKGWRQKVLKSVVFCLICQKLLHIRSLTVVATAKISHFLYPRVR